MQPGANLFRHALVVQRLFSQYPYPHTTGASREASSSPEVCGCRELGSQVQRARLSCAGAESRIPIYAESVIPILQFRGQSGCGELRQSRGAESWATHRCREPRVSSAQDTSSSPQGRHRDALPPRKGRRGRKRSRGREAHSLQGSESGSGEGVMARTLLQRQEGQFRP